MVLCGDITKCGKITIGVFMSPEIKEYCIRCGSPDYLELTAILNTEQRDGKTVYIYNNKCNKCGRVMDYVSPDGGLLSERTLLRDELLRPVVPFSDKVSQRSDEVGFQETTQEFKQPGLKNRTPKQIDLDAKQQERQEAGLLD